jgi:hypothetical protein
VAAPERDTNDCRQRQQAPQAELKPSGHVVILAGQLPQTKVGHRRLSGAAAGSALQKFGR